MMNMFVHGNHAVTLDGLCQVRKRASISLILDHGVLTYVDKDDIVVSLEMADALLKMLAARAEAEDT